MTITPGLLALLAVIAYATNVLTTGELSLDRLALRGPIVALFATFAYTVFTLGFGDVVGFVVYAAVILGDVTPGKFVGAHA